MPRPYNKLLLPDKRKHWQKQGYENTPRKLSWEAFHDSLRKQDHILFSLLDRLDVIDRRLDRVENALANSIQKKVMRKKN